MPWLGGSKAASSGRYIGRKAIREAAERGRYLTARGGQPSRPRDAAVHQGYRRRPALLDADHPRIRSDESGFLINNNPLAKGRRTTRAAPQGWQTARQRRAVCQRPHCDPLCRGRGTGVRKVGEEEQRARIGPSVTTTPPTSEALDPKQSGGAEGLAVRTTAAFAQKAGCKGLGAGAPRPWRPAFCAKART